MQAKTKKLLRLVISALVVGVIGYFVAREYMIDRCLDSSGGWDFEKNECVRG